MSHMDANLMGAAGFQTTLHISILLKSLKNMNVRNRILPAAIRNDRHFLPVIPIPSDVPRDGKVIFLQNAEADGDVPAHNGMLLQLRGNALMRQIVFADDHRACGVPVDAMHDTGPHDAVNAGKRLSAVVHNRIDKRPLVVTRGGMNHHALRLVDYENVLIFIQNIERQIFRDNIRKDFIRNGKGYRIVFLHFHGRLG